MPHLLLVTALVLSVYSQLMMKSLALVRSSMSDAPERYTQYLIGMAMVQLIGLGLVFVSVTLSALAR